MMQQKASLCALAKASGKGREAVLWGVDPNAAYSASRPTANKLFSARRLNGLE